MSNQVNSYSGVITEKKEKKSGVTKDNKDWVNQDFIIQTNDKYPKIIKFTAKSNTIDSLDFKQVGESVSVDFIIEGKEYNGVVYNNVIATKIY